MASLSLVPDNGLGRCEEAETELTRVTKELEELQKTLLAEPDVPEPGAADVDTPFDPVADAEARMQARMQARARAERALRGIKQSTPSPLHSCTLLTATAHTVPTPSPLHSCSLLTVACAMVCGMQVRRW
jgi:hypothetical protein